MREAARGLVMHLAGYAAPHVVIAIVLAVRAFITFAPGGESSTRFEAATLQLFMWAVFLTGSGVGYACAIALVARQHATLRFPSVFGVVAGAVILAFAAVGGVNDIARATGLSMFSGLPVLGFMVGIAASLFVVLAARMFRDPRRA